jgi:thioesterase domain-containing protein
VQEGAVRRWEARFSRPLARREVEGDHYSMLREPAVRELASTLEELLEEDVA